MTKGNETSLLIRFSLPMLFGNVFQQFYNMVDSIVVGNYVGKNALAAVGMTSSLTFFYFALCNGFATGAGVLMSQYFGMKNEKRVKDALGNSIYLMLGMGILVSIISVLLAEPTLRLLNTPESIFDDALLYTRIVCGGVLAVVLYNGISAMLRALGDSVTPLIFLIIASMLECDRRPAFRAGVSYGRGRSGSGNHSGTDTVCPWLHRICSFEKSIFSAEKEKI